MLLVDLIDTTECFSHYILIDSTSFFKKQYLRSDNTVYAYADNRFCPICFYRSRSESMLQKHQKVCQKNTCMIEFPSPEKKLTFTKTECMFKRIYQGYADFESVLLKTNENTRCTTCSQVEDELHVCPHRFSIDTEIHKPISVAFIVVDRNGEIVKEYYYTGNDVVEKFLNEVLGSEQDLLNITRMNKYMIISPEQQKDFDLAETCYICNNRKNGKYKPFTRDDDKRRDHCHISVRL